MMRSNTRSTFLMTKHAIPHLKKTRGNIVFTGSITAIMGAAELSVYGASKGFVHAFMMGIALEQAVESLTSQHSPGVAAHGPDAAETRQTCCRYHRRSTTRPGRPPRALPVGPALGRRRPGSR